MNNHVYEILNIRGEDVQIDVGCIPMVKLFNSVGLDTKYCCEKNGERNFYKYYIMFENYISDDNIVDLVGKCVDEDGFNILAGQFRKWCRPVPTKGKKEVWMNWIYEVENLEMANLDYEVFKKVLEETK